MATASLARIRIAAPPGCSWVPAGLPIVHGYFARWIISAPFLDPKAPASFPEYEEPRRWILGLAGVHTATELRFDDLRAGQSRNALVATVGYAPTSKLLLQASAGITFAGSLEVDSQRYAFDPGPTLAAGVAYRAIDGDVFLTLSGVLSSSFARTERRDAYTALDLRIGAAFGVAVFEWLSPYLVGRAFGGPVFWRYRGDDVVGTDATHVQLGAGFALSIAERFEVFVEGAPLGEQALAAGAAVAL